MPRRRLHRSSFFALALLGVVTAHAPLAAQSEPFDLDSIPSRITTWVRTVMDTAGIPAISVAVVQGGRVAWAGAFGYANVAARVPATTDTYFSTGSTFKFVTSTAILQLVEGGLVTLDTPLNEIVGPEHAVPGADDVTLRHLLSHHSGLEGPVKTVPLWSREAPITPVEILAQTRRVGPPGVKYRYCNECYGILGYVIEEVSGQPYDEYIAEHILNPLGIDVKAPSVPGPRVVERLALPYGLEDGKPVPVAQVRFNVFAAGDVYLRASDMARLLAAHLNGGVYGEARILDPASVAEMDTPQFEDSRYGLGINTTRLNGHAILLHNGSIPGFKAVMTGDPETGCGVYVMANSNASARAINLLARYVMLLFWGEE